MTVSLMPLIPESPAPASQALPWAAPRVRLLSLSGVLLPAAGLMLLLASSRSVSAELPSPVIGDIFPLGVQAGTSALVTVSGTHLDGLSTLHVSEARIQVEKTGDATFRLTAPADLPAGFYDICAVGNYGVSGPRLFHVSRKREFIEPAPSDPSAGPARTPSAPTDLPLGTIVNGRIAAAGEIDRFRFEGQAGETVVVECWANRIDSQLRAVLELFDSDDRRLAVSRGESQLDPCIHLRLPTDGAYGVKLTDLTYTGSQQHFYRLAVGTGPRVEFALPTVLRRGTTNRVTLFGHNLARLQPSDIGNVEPVGVSAGLGGPRLNDEDVDSAHVVTGASPAIAHRAIESLEINVTVPAGQPVSAVPARLSAAQAALDFFAYDLPGADEPVLFSVTDVSIAVDEGLDDAGGNHSPQQAQKIGIPCEVSGQLISGDEQDWYAFEAGRGEVVWFNVFGERLGSPVDLELLLLDDSGDREILRMNDELDNVGPASFPTAHLDPQGRWVAPAEGRYLLMLRNLSGGLHDDPRRVYRLSLRREEQDFQVAVVPRRAGEHTGLNVWRGGRAMADVVAFRSPGMAAPIRITVDDLPPGIECPDVWLGPHIVRAPLVVTAQEEVPLEAVALRLTARAELSGEERVRAVRGGTAAVSLSPLPAGRVTPEILLGIGPVAPLTVSVEPQAAKVPQGGFVEVQVSLSRSDNSHPPSVELTAVGLPANVPNELSAIPEGHNDGWISFDLPASLPPGPYTFAVQAATEVLLAGGEKTNVTAVSSPITIEVYAAPFLLSVDLHTPKKIARGEIIQLNYRADRKNGFIGKIHTELRATGGLTGLRGRGVTFVNGTASGTIQIIASDDAPLGPVKFLHLDAVGTVEDEPIYRSGCFVDLEITP